MQRAEGLARACVHCGFCNATCPTYLLTGDEREGPRGRLYLMNSLLSGSGVGLDLTPLDHCLSCRSCETTCPAGVHYTEILDTVREHTDGARPVPARLVDRITETALSSRRAVSALMQAARLLRPLTKGQLKRRIRPKAADIAWPTARHSRRIGILQGCVQPALAPDLDIKAALVLDRLGISAIPVGPGCCGALPYHLHAADKAREQARTTLALAKNETWEGLTSTATGCTAFLHSYPRLFHDSVEAEEARVFAGQVADIAHWIDPAQLPLLPPDERLRIAWHAPCSLQHDLRSADRVEAILKALGHTLVPVAESALCCGSAGPYSLRHPRWAAQLGLRKWQALTAAEPVEVVSANIGCLQHLSAHSDRPIRHWLELVYDALTTRDTAARD